MRSPALIPAVIRMRITEDLTAMLLYRHYQIVTAK
mgnify:CR=1 FL=1